MFFNSAAIASFIALVFLSGLLWLEMNQHFPRLPEGYYVGELRGANTVSEGDKLSWAIWSEKGRYFTILLNSGFQAIDVDPLSRSNGEHFPLRVPLQNDTLYMVGRELQEGDYRGTYSELESQDAGRWTLRRISAEPGALSPEKQEEALLWLHFRKEYEDHRGARLEVKEQEAALSARHDQLNELLSDLENLKEQGSQNLIEIKQELQNTRKMIQQEELTLRKLFEHFALTRKVSKMGELLQLARDIREKEFQSLRDPNAGERSF